jgi:hypothetical protein
MIYSGAPLAAEGNDLREGIRTMRKAILATLAAFMIACSSSVAPPTPVPAAQLHFVLQDSTAPHLLSDSASFYAKAGEDRRVELFYSGMVPGDTGEPLLQFVVPANSLLKRPDGTAFQPGDSILITVAVADPTRFDFIFAPAGLQFNPTDPARLRIEYNHSNHDYDGDGRQDSVDAHAKTLLSFWRRDPPDTLWTNVGAVNSEEFEEMETSILSFSHYAVAW